MKELDPNFVLAMFDGSVQVPLDDHVGGNLDPDLGSGQYTESVYKFLEGELEVSEFLGRVEETECEPCLPEDAYEPEEDGYSWSEVFWPDDGFDWSREGYSWSEENQGWFEDPWYSQQEVQQPGFHDAFDRFVNPQNHDADPIYLPFDQQHCLD